MVSGEGEIVNSIDVSPIPVSRKRGSIDVFMRKRTSNELGRILVRFTNASGMSEIVCVVVRDFSNLSSISDVISPGIQRNSPVTIAAFDVKHVNSSQLSVETLFTPIRSPRISDNPILFIIFFTPTNNFDNVIGSWI